MPRKPKLRVNDGADGQYLLRLAHALEQDTRRPTPWRAEAMALARSLANKLMEYGEIQENQDAQDAQKIQGEKTSGQEDSSQETTGQEVPETQTPKEEISDQESF